MCEAGSSHLPHDVQLLLMLSRTYKWEALQHRYRCQKLAEYILHINRLQDVSSNALPAVPEEIAYYVQTTNPPS